MAYIDNSETARELVEAIRGNANTNLPPKTLNNSIQPVININPKDYRRCNIVRARTTAGVIYTTPSDKDFFLTSSFLSIFKLGTDTGADATITCVIDGATQTLMIISGVTLTANSIYAEKNLTFPIKVDRGTAITSSATNISRCGAGICGFTVEP